MSEIVITKFSNLESDDPMLHIKEKKRDDLMEVLMERLLDENSFARASVLNNLSYLLASKVIPQDTRHKLFFSACDRIKDVSKNVRKKALVLVS